MKLRELIKRTTVIEDASVFAGATRNWDRNVPEIYLGITDVGTHCRLFSLDLTREETERLIEQLQAALAVPPYTDEEIRNHREHVAFRREKELGYGR